jgi:hypothetical protein
MRSGGGDVGAQAFAEPSTQAVAAVIYVAAALVWLIPDRRIEHVLHAPESGDAAP